MKSGRYSVSTCREMRSDMPVCTIAPGSVACLLRQHDDCVGRLRLAGERSPAAREFPVMWRISDGESPDPPKVRWKLPEA